MWTEKISVMERTEKNCLLCSEDNEVKGMLLFSMCNINLFITFVYLTYYSIMYSNKETKICKIFLDYLDSRVSIMCAN